MARLQALSVLAFCACATLLPAAAGSGHPVIGWYNGEWQSGIPGLSNWYFDPANCARVYDEFEVPEGGWIVVGVFSDNSLYDFPRVTHAFWEIRRAIGPGHGGTVVA